MELVIDKKFPLVFFLIVLVKLTFSLEISLCCPYGYEVVKSANIYLCDLSNDQEFGLYLKPESGFSITNSSVRNIPQCEGILIYPISIKNIDLSLNSCLAVMNGRYVTLSCPILSIGEPKIQVRSIKKCCPIGESYNFNKKTCEISNQLSNKMFGELLSVPTVFEKGDLDHCINESVIIQYFTLNSYFRLEHQDLIVDGLRYSSDSYCLELVLPTDHVTDEDLNIGYESLPSRQIFMARTCHASYSICDEIPCIRRCCGGWEKFKKSTGTKKCFPHSGDMNLIFHNIKNVDNKLSPVPVKPKVFGILHHQTCQKYPLKTVEEEIEHYFEPEKGNLYLPDEKHDYGQKEYCVEYLENNTNIELAVYVCFEAEEKYIPQFYAYILVISCIFLVLTLIVYLFLPGYLNLHGKTLTCYLSSLLMAYCILAMKQLSTSYQLSRSYTLIIIMHFSFMSAFLWLNVICIDIWWTFGSVDRVQGIRKQSEWKRFLFYSLYAWGTASILTLITFFTDYFQWAKRVIPVIIHEDKGWFETGSLAHFIFFLLPIGILAITNIILFIFTVRYCNKVRNDLHRMQNVTMDKSYTKKRFSVDKAKLVMNAKLFIVMGVSYLLEVISAIVHQNNKIFIIFVFFDVYNASQGILIFLIFICKRRIFEALKQKLGLTTNNRPISRTPMSNTATTTLTNSSDQRTQNMRSAESSTSLLADSPSPSTLAKKKP